MVCRRRRKSTSSFVLQQQGPSWPSAWRQDLLCASPRKPIWHLSSTVSRHSCQGHTHTHRQADGRRHRSDRRHQRARSVSRCIRRAFQGRLIGTGTRAAAAAAGGSGLRKISGRTCVVGRLIASGRPALCPPLATRRPASRRDSRDTAPVIYSHRAADATYNTLYEALNPLTLSKDYLNPFYFQSHTLAFHHSQLQHVIPLSCISLCNAPL